MKLLSCVRLFATPRTAAYQAPPSMGFSRQEYWSGLPFPCPGDLPHPGIEPRSPTLQEDVLTSEPKVSSTLATPWTVARQAPLTIGFSRNTGVSCHFLLQGIFPIQESNSGLLHGRQILNRLSQEGSPSHQGTLLKVFVLALLEEHLLCRRHIIK